MRLPVVSKNTDELKTRAPGQESIINDGYHPAAGPEFQRSSIFPKNRAI